MQFGTMTRPLPTGPISQQTHEWYGPFAVELKDIYGMGTEGIFRTQNNSSINKIRLFPMCP